MQQDSVTCPCWESNQVTNPSPLVPDLNISTDAPNRNTVRTYQPTVDFRFTWLFTGQQSDTSKGTIFDGNIVIMENRPFSIDAVQVTPPATSSTGWPARSWSRRSSATTATSCLGSELHASGYGVASNRVVMLRWPATLPDPEVKVGSWIADVTYERHLVDGERRRFASVRSAPGTMDNLPAQRCFWYQVSKVTPPADATGTLAFAGDPGPYRYMMIWTGTDLRAKTVLNVNTGQPAVLNAALVSPHVVNVFPRTFVLTK